MRLCGLAVVPGWRLYHSMAYGIPLRGADALLTAGPPGPFAIQPADCHQYRTVILHCLASLSVACCLQEAEQLLRGAYSIALVLLLLLLLSMLLRILVDGSACTSADCHS